MRWVRMPLLALSLLAGTGMTRRDPNPEVWFNPHVPLDMMDMWTDDAPWQHAAHKVQVLELVYWVMEEWTDAQVLEVTDFARHHHMKILLSLEAIGFIPGNPCGTVEGYSSPAQMTDAAATLHRLGVTVDMISMDEPLEFGHYDTDPGACQLSVPDLAANIAANISGILALYPNVEMYEIEPIPSVTNFPDWRQAMDQFQTLLWQATGLRMKGVETDTGWDSPGWIPALAELHTFLHERNMRLGIIEDPSDVARNNADAVASVAQHYEYMEGTLGIIPDFVDFTTWGAYPQYNMPETSPTAQTWEINRYFRKRTLLQAQFVGEGAQGKLTTEDGEPIAGATINGYIPGVDFSQPLPTTVIQDVVPSYAVAALMGVRLNVECACGGLNDVLVGKLQYQETQGGTSSYSYQYSPVSAIVNGAIIDGEEVGGTRVARFITMPAQDFYTNSGIFPVTPGAQYSFTVPASTIGGEGWYGNVFLLWIDVNGNGILRVNVVPSSGKRLMSTATTAADGTFQLSTLPPVGPGSAPVTVEFAGDDTHRSVAWSPLP